MNKHPSEKLLKLIELANLVPRDSYLPNAKQIFQEFFCTDREPELPEAELGFLAIRRSVKKIKFEIRRYPDLMKQIKDCLLSLNADMEVPVWREYLNYDNFCRNREIFWYYAGGEGAISNTGVFAKPLGKRKFSASITKLDPMIFDMGGSILREGKEQSFEINIVEPELKNLDLSHLRICHNCQRIFFALRKDNYGCSDKCNNVHRVKKSRLKNFKRKSGETFPSRVKKDARSD